MDCVGVLVLRKKADSDSNRALAGTYWTRLTFKRRTCSSPYNAQEPFALLPARAGFGALTVGRAQLSPSSAIFSTGAASKFGIQVTALPTSSWAHAISDCTRLSGSASNWLTALAAIMT